MRNRGCVALAVVVVLGLAIAEAPARPGGRRGGGPRGGGAPAAKARAGSQAAQQRLRNPRGKLQSAGPRNQLGNPAGGNFRQKVSRLKTNFTPANQPFTPAWYANHPRAWQYAHPHADAWAVATFGAAATWLGISATAADGSTVYTGETAGGDEPVDEQLADESQPQEEQDARENDNGQGEFLPLGVFAVAPPGEPEASALVQLAVDKQGNLRGNYYNVLTGADHAVSGTLDKKTRLATFAVRPHGKVTFETTLASLTKPSGLVTLRFASGKTRQWTLARFEDPATDAAAATR